MPKRTGRYKEEQLNVLKEIREGRISRHAASRTYNIPRSTIQFRLGANFVKTRPGPNTFLTLAEEDEIVCWLVASYRKGFPKRKEDVLSAVKTFLTENPRDHPFGIGNRPGNGWYKAFLKRHPIIKMRTPESVTAASANVGAQDIKKWFYEVEVYLKEEGMFSILSNPNRIFNGDETCFQLCPKTKQVLAPRGSRNVYEVDQGVAKSNLTVMFTFSAVGDCTPPLIIYPYVRMPEEIRKSAHGWDIAVSENGWMTREIFYEYISKVFYPYLVKIGTVFPILLFVDGHSTHLTLPLSKLCKQLEIILVALYPTATRILQPADVAAFKPLKSGWQKGVLDWRRKNPSVMLTRDKFAPLLKVVLENSIKSKIIQNGFRTCGIYPWNPEAIDYSKCLGRSTNFLTKSKTSSGDPFSVFTEVVGAKRLLLFAEMDKETSPNKKFSQDTLLLFELYKRFKPTAEGTDDLACNTAEISGTQSIAEPPILHRKN